MLADISQGRCSKKGIANGMKQDVGIRMPQQTQLRGNVDASQDQLPLWTQAMNIVAEPRADHFYLILNPENWCWHGSQATLTSVTSANRGPTLTCWIKSSTPERSPSTLISTFPL